MNNPDSLETGPNPEREARKWFTIAMVAIAIDILSIVAFVTVR